MHLEIEKDYGKLNFIRSLLGGFHGDKLLQLMERTPDNKWLYFNRFKPTRILIHTDEDFEPGQDESFFDRYQVKMDDLLPQTIQPTENDLLSLHLDNRWIDFIYHESTWIELLSPENYVWKHYLRCEGVILG